MSAKGSCFLTQMEKCLNTGDPKIQDPQYVFLVSLQEVLGHPFLLTEVFPIFQTGKQRLQGIQSGKHISG